MGATTGIVIRPALPADVEPCIALAAGSGEPPTGLTEDLADADRLLLVAERAGRVIGYGRAVWFQPGDGAPADTAPAGYYLVGLAVDASYRRRGIGSRLTRARLEWIGTRAAEAWYFANTRNTGSIGLHAWFGFREA